MANACPTAQLALGDLSRLSEKVAAADAPTARHGRLAPTSQGGLPPGRRTRWERASPRPPQTERSGTAPYPPCCARIGVMIDTRYKAAHRRVLLGRRGAHSRPAVPRFPQQQLRALAGRGLTTPGGLPHSQCTAQPYAHRATESGVVVQQPCRLVEFGDLRVVRPKRNISRAHGGVSRLTYSSAAQARSPYAAALLVAHRPPASPRGPRRPWESTPLCRSAGRMATRSRASPPQRPKSARDAPSSALISRRVSRSRPHSASRPSCTTTGDSPPAPLRRPDTEPCRTPHPGHDRGRPRVRARAPAPASEPPRTRPGAGHAPRPTATARTADPRRVPARPSACKRSVSADSSGSTVAR